MEYYSNNYSKYIEQLKLEKSQKAFKDLVESTKEVKPNKIIVDNIPSEKDGDKVYYENKDFSSTSSKSVSVEDNKSSYSAPSKIEHDIDLPNSSEYSSIQRYHELKESSKSNDKIDHDAVYSNKSGKELEVDNTVSDKDSAELRFSSEASDKSSSDIELENLPSEKIDSDLNKEVTISNKNEEDISLNNYPVDKLSISLNKDITLSDKNLVSLNKDIETSDKNINNISKEYTASIKSDNNISKEYATSEKSNSNISKELIASNKSSDDIIASIKEEKKANKKITTLSIAGSNKNKDEFKILIAQPKKKEITNLNRQYIYFAYDPKEKEAETYEKYAKDYNYYPAGSYSSINARQSQAIEDTFRTLVNKSNWDSLGKSIVNGIKIVSNVIDMFNLTGPAKNIYNPDTTSNNLRLDLKIDNESLSSGEDYKENHSVKIKDSINEKKDSDSENQEEKTNEKKESEISYVDPNTETEYINATEEGALSKKEEKEVKLFKYYDDDSNVNAAYSQEPKLWYNDYSALGRIYVIPPYKELANSFNLNTDVAFTIPLQNNLKFETISRAAAWNAVQFFGRIGDVQQYLRTGSIDAISISTQYFVEDDYDPSDPDNRSKFTMADLQNIEMMYRSLVLPSERQSTYLNDSNDSTANSNTFNYFTRPPVINIVLGQRGEKKSEGSDSNNNIIKNNKVYNNLFTDVISTKVSSEKDDLNHKIVYKNFIVTNVSIDKNQNDYNYYVEEDEDGKCDYKDVMGFTVTLTIIEIDENYLNSTPSFNNYYNTLFQRGKLS